MSVRDLDVIGMGNAIVDVLAKADDAFLTENDILKGGMVLIEEDRAKSIYDAMGPGVEISGGSVANSMSCVASLGGKSGFIGKVADDELGGIYRHDMSAIGVEFNTEPLKDGIETGRCLINVTPDAQRSMSTFLGAAWHLSPEDVSASFIERAQITFFEGYLFEMPIPREGFKKASGFARAAGAKTALTLSDSGCVERQHKAFLSFIEESVDILLANEEEAKALFETEDFGEIEKRARELCPLTAITRSEKGSVLVPREGESVSVAAHPPTQLVDTTGAGDAYAAGFLYGLSQNLDLATSGALGSLAAREVISHYGARPETSLRELAENASLL